MKNLHDKVALVTGSASGIGKATALKLAEEGAHLVLADINEEGLKSASSEIEALGRKALSVKTDVSKRDQVEQLCQKALAEFGRVDILMNNAGVALISEIKDTEFSEWEWILGIHLWGAIYTIHYLLPQMVERKSGHIINISSWAGILGTPTCGAYATAKFGLVGMSEVLRIELERFDIGVTVVCPGMVKTNVFSSAKMKGFKREFLEKSGTFGISPEAVARKIVRAVKRNQAVVLTDLAKVAWSAKRLSPALGRQFLKVFLKASERARG